MNAVQLTAARTLEWADVRNPASPTRGEVLLQVLSVGICGSDLHMYETASIGTTRITEPMILGHEFCGRILEAPIDAENEQGEPLEVGMRVAVEPHVACRKCEQCLEGNPNLCPHHYFYGVSPDHGALCERMLVQASNCFPIPQAMSSEGGALLEPLGVAIHALDLAKLKIGETVAVIGCGPIGALIARLAKLAGASRVLAFDLLDWRVQFARAWGANAIKVDQTEAPSIVDELTNGRGVDVVFEAAWSDHTVQQSVDMAKYGGRLVMVGIPPDDNVSFGHSLARRKGLTIRLARRMKHTYPRALQLVSGETPAVDIDQLVSHRYPLEETARAFEEAAGYVQGLMKAMVTVAPPIP